MSLLFLTVLGGIVLLGLIAILWSRGALIAALLVPGSEFFGLVDPAVLTIKGAFDTFALLMLMLGATLLVCLPRIGELSKAVFLGPFLILLTLFTYGLLAPVLRGDSTGLLAVNASKEFMMIFAYPAVYLFVRTERDTKIAWWLLLSLGAYYSALELIAQVGGVGFMRMFTYLYRPDDFGLWKVYVQYWPVILVFLLWCVFASVLRGRIGWWSVSLAGAGLLLTFYRSYLLATVVVIPVVLMWARARMGRLVIAGAVFLVGIASVLMTVALVNDSKATSFANIGNDLVLSGVRELREDTGGSLAGRRRHANELLRVADAHPLVGYGFVKQEAALIVRLKLATFAGGMLGFVDKGDADVLVKFGLLGAVALYGAFVWVAWIGIIRARVIQVGDRPTDEAAYMLVVAALALIFLLVQPVHAPCTYGFALLPFSIAMAIADRRWQLRRGARTA